ncbi:hypothetical protein I545_3973 [Mycobacterium kansasii 662]|uniref:Uncharacterized protein n=1 Tax=Mycobacterium kansasii 662 TaxID=1299326 RepID=X7ZDI8_MYCKA|nr:hypothetical protein I545_3973 [Mycobacterium kansasii 662]
MVFGVNGTGCAARGAVLEGRCYPTRWDAVENLGNRVAQWNCCLSSPSGNGRG